MADVPPTILWSVVRKGHAYMKKRNGACFSTEPRNLSGLHRFKDSGLAQKRAVGMTTKDKQIVMTLATDATNKPAASVKDVVLQHERSPASTINEETAKSFYRPDLRATALARHYRLRTAARTRSGKPAPPRGIPRRH